MFRVGRPDSGRPAAACGKHKKRAEYPRLCLKLRDLPFCFLARLLFVRRIKASLHRPES
jgi:hypothetical protein